MAAAPGSRLSAAPLSTTSLLFNQIKSSLHLWCCRRPGRLVSVPLCSRLSLRIIALKRRQGPAAGAAGSLKLSLGQASRRVAGGRPGPEVTRWPSCIYEAVCEPCSDSVWHKVGFLVVFFYILSFALTEFVVLAPLCQIHLYTSCFLQTSKDCIGLQSNQFTKPFLKKKKNGSEIHPLLMSQRAHIPLLGQQEPLQPILLVCPQKLQQLTNIWEGKKGNIIFAEGCKQRIK